MNGSAFVIGKNGLYCTNDADFTTHQEFTRDENGKISAGSTSKTINVIQIMNFMKISGEFQRDDEVYCQFKFDETNEVQTYSAVISGIAPEMLFLHLKARNIFDTEVLNTIKNKIKEEINHGS